MAPVYQFEVVEIGKLISLRHHIYSLAAVFFALAIGIVIGSGFSKRRPATTAEQRIIARYADSMRALKEDIEATAKEASQKKADAENYEEFCRALLPLVASGKLAGSYVAVVQTGDDDELVGPISRALEAAGATVTGVTKLRREFDFADEKQVRQALEQVGVRIADPREARAKLFRVIATVVKKPGNGALMSRLERTGAASFDGDYDHTTRLIVLVGGANVEVPSHGDLMDTQLIAELDDDGAVVVGCESHLVRLSYVPFWHRMGIATVDNADTTMGQISMLYALKGEKANFGAKETADRLIPRNLDER